MVVSRRGYQAHGQSLRRPTRGTDLQIHEGVTAGRPSRAAILALSLPLAVLSWLAAHCLAYWLVSPGPQHHMGIHSEADHAYLGYSPAFGLWILALVLAGLVLCVGEGLRGRRPARPPVRLFALLPPIGFTVQEHLERLIGSGAIPYDLVLEPTFLVGLGLQLPFALAALLLVLVLQALGLGAGGALAGRFPLRAVRGATPSPPTLPVPPKGAVRSVLTPGHGPRAPPASASL